MCILDKFILYKDCSGTLTYDEFQAHMTNPVVKAYFSGLDIDPDETKIIFTLLDSDCNGDIDIEEFVHGTMKLKGYAARHETLYVLLHLYLSLYILIILSM